jgi:ligand-binding SRPBCC domain-containing protein
MLAAVTACTPPSLELLRAGGDYLLLARQHVPRERDEVFAFFAEPRNLALITPPWLAFRIRESGDSPIREGTRIRYTIRWLGLPVNWLTCIARCEPPSRFVDVQARGPYALWEHTHTFVALDGDRPGTLVEDHVRYRLPLGPVGHAAHALLVGAQLREIFSYRARRIAALLPAAKPGPFTAGAAGSDAECG